MNNLTTLQKLGIAMIIFGALGSGTAQLTDLFGPTIAKDISSAVSLLNSILGGIVTMFGGQGSQLKNVAALPGVEKIEINGLANQTVAQVAVDPTQMKVAATPSALQTVAETAKGV